MSRIGPVYVKVVSLGGLRMPYMTRDEVAIFLAFDSADDAFPGAPHCAFDDPTCPADALPRASCELRAYVYWG